MSQPKATQHDVAKAAEVSQALVSLVLNGMEEGVAEATRTRILEEAKRLGYAPKKKPSALKRQKLIGYIRPVVLRGHHDEHWIYNSYEEYYDGIQNLFVQEAYKAGYSVIVRPYAETGELTRWLTEWGVDGVLWHGPDPNLARWIAKRYPMVQINRLTIDHADTVATNQEDLVVTAMDHLCAKGHTRIVFIPAQPATSPLRRLRNRAYLDYVQARGLPSFESTFPFHIDQSLAEMHDRLFELLSGRKEERPTAVIVGDHDALQIMKRSHEMGLLLPDDLSIVGIDNISAGAFTTPALTTINTRNDEIARLAVYLLLERIRDPQAPFRKMFVTPSLVERQSVALLAGKTPARSSSLKQEI